MSKDREKVVIKHIKKCTKSLGKCSVEQTATLRAWSFKNDLDVDPYRTQVVQELQDDDEESDNSD